MHQFIQIVTPIVPGERTGGVFVSWLGWYLNYLSAYYNLAACAVTHACPVKSSGKLKRDTIKNGAIWNHKSKINFGKGDGLVVVIGVEKGELLTGYFLFFKWIRVIASKLF